MRYPGALRTLTPYAITRSRKAWDRWYLEHADQLWRDVALQDEYHGKPLSFVWARVRESMRTGFEFLSREYGEI